MKKLRIAIILLIIPLLLVGCQEKEYELNKEVTLKGTITNNEIIKDDVKYNISVLNLDEPIIIDGTKINKIELDYDKNLKNNAEVTITGILNANNNSTINLKYSLAVNDVDDILSYINTFSNEDFSVTIPVDIIKICSIEKIDKGFIIYSSKDKTKESEVFRIISVSNEEFKKLQDNENGMIEKVASNRTKKIIIVYPSDSNNNYEEFDAIIKHLNDIKNTVKIK